MYFNQLFMTVVSAINTVETPYRWMDQKIATRAGAAVDRGELLEAGIYAEVTRIAAERGADVQIFVGRILSETGEDEKDPKVPINTHSLLLEGCTGRAAGRTVRLFVHECPEFLLYSGQIVGAVGRLMAAGAEFHADQLVTGIPYSPVSTNLLESKQTSELVVLAASGPYSPENMLIFDAISELEVRVRETSPDVLILMGPFLDVNHPLVASGTVNDSFGRAASFDDIYREEIFPKLARLSRACEAAKTELFIVPALSEARFDFPLPQPPWQKLAKEDLTATTKLVSNPATIQVGDYSLLVSSTDALSSLNANILFKQAEGGLARVDACLDQMLRARSLFPVNPSGLRINPALRYCLDISTTLPDVVVFPSAGRRFVKTVSEKHTFVNPGSMSDPTGSVSTVASIILPRRSAGSNEKVSAEILKL